MTALRDLQDRLDLNPEAAYPPFAVFLDLPADWTLLDTNPATWERSAQNMLDTTFHRSRLTGKERREIIAFFEQLVADCQQAGAAVSLIQVGRLLEGGAASLGVHLAFGDEKAPADLGRIRDSLARSGTITEIDSGVGPALLQQERTTIVPPGATALVAMTSIQIFIPIPGSHWTAVLATASAHPELTDPVDQLLRHIAASLRLTEEPTDAVATIAEHTGDGPDPADAGGRQDTFAAAPTAAGPGIERGFSTFVRKHLGPDPAPADARDTDTDTDTGATDTGDGDPRNPS